MLVKIAYLKVFSVSQDEIEVDGLIERETPVEELSRLTSHPESDPFFEGTEWAGARKIISMSKRSPIWTGEDSEELYRLVGESLKSVDVDYFIIFKNNSSAMLWMTNPYQIEFHVCFHMRAPRRLIK
jgi:hypothetical protein